MLHSPCLELRRFLTKSRRASRELRPPCWAGTRWLCRPQQRWASTACHLLPTRASLTAFWPSAAQRGNLPELEVRQGWGCNLRIPPSAACGDGGTWSVAQSRCSLSHLCQAEKSSSGTPTSRFSPKSPAAPGGAITARSRSWSCSRRHVPSVRLALSISQMEGEGRASPSHGRRTERDPDTKLNHFIRSRCEQDAGTHGGPLQHFPQLYASCSAGCHSPRPAVCRQEGSQQGRTLLGLISSLRSASHRRELQEEGRHSQQGRAQHEAGSQ